MKKATAPSTKSVSTRIDTAAVYDHYLHVISDLQSDDAICKSLELYGIKSLPDLLDMDRDDIKTLEYIDSSGNNTPLHRGGQGRVRVMQAYFRYLREEGIDDILSLAHEDFNDFRMDIYDPNSLPTPSSKLKKPSSLPTIRQPAEEFKKGIKRDKSHYTVLKEDKQWDNWRRTTLATARSHGCEDIFDSTYRPKTTEERDLFIEKQKFIYSVFDEYLQTDTGKSLVRTYEVTYNAQQIYTELKAHATTSTQATIDTDELLSYLTSTKLDKNQWRGTHHAFILIGVISFVNTKA